MLLILARSFQVTLTKSYTFSADSKYKLFRSFLCSLSTKNLLLLTEQQSKGTEIKNPLDTDAYIVPYLKTLENRAKNNNFVLDTLRKRFSLTANDIEKVLSDDTVHLAHKKKFLKQSLEVLCSYGITKRTLLDCSWLITLEPKRLEVKLQDLNAMNIKDTNDFAPLLRLTYPRFNKLLASLRRESYVPFGNRIYYLSEKLQLSPFVVTKYLSKRLFILEMPFDMLRQNLEHMLNYNITSLNILRDLWAFRYTPKSVETRLERAKRAKKDKIMPWMVRCPENILQRSFQISIDEDKILGEKESAVAYVAERLGFTVPVTQAILNKHPAVLKVRVPKIKEVLDYLLDEENFSRHDVAQVPRIMCHSLKTTKERINELKLVGCRVSSLVIVCKSKREYNKFLNNWLEVKTKIESSSKKGK